jgi:hypothetical protein
MALVHDRRQLRESEWATVECLEELTSLSWKSLKPVGRVAGCMLKCTVGFRALPSKSPKFGYPKFGDNRKPKLGARHVGNQP